MDSRFTKGDHVHSKRDFPMTGEQENRGDWRRECRFIARGLCLDDQVNASSEHVVYVLRKHAVNGVSNECLFYDCLLIQARAPYAVVGGTGLPLSPHSTHSQYLSAVQILAYLFCLFNFR